MVMAGRRAYSDARKWIASARPARSAREGFGFRCFWGSFVAGVIVLGLIGVLSPSSFGEVGAKPFRGGWPALLLLGVVLLAVLLVALRSRHLVWLAARVREPLTRPLEEDPGYEGAVGALQECPSPLRGRFAFALVWGPLILATLATFAAFSAAYFLVDAILQRFQVGWQQPLYGVGYIFVSIVLWRIASARLLTWRLAMSVHKTVSTGYVS